MINIDLPDIKDFIAEHILGEPKQKLGGEDLKFLNLNNIMPHNQKNTMKCTAYALTHIFQIMNKVDLNVDVKFNPEEQWSNQKKYPATASESGGDYLQSALKSLKKTGLTYENKKYTIDGYAQIKKTEADIKKWLRAGHPVYTGAVINDSIDSIAKSTAVYDFSVNGRTEYGHCFIIVGYSEDGKSWICLNSYGTEYANKGEFYIRLADTHRLFTPYIIYDTDDLPAEKPVFLDVNKNSNMYDDIMWAYDNGLIKGYEDTDESGFIKKTFRPNAPITRGEATVIMKRLYNLIKSGK